MFSKFLEGEETSKADAKFNGFIVDKKILKRLRNFFLGESKNQKASAKLHWKLGLKTRLSTRLA